MDLKRDRIQCFVIARQAEFLVYLFHFPQQQNKDVHVAAIDLLDPV